MKIVYRCRLWSDKDCYRAEESRPSRCNDQEKYYRSSLPRSSKKPTVMKKRIGSLNGNWDGNWK